MKCTMKRLLLLIFLSFIALPAFSQIEAGVHETVVPTTIKAMVDDSRDVLSLSNFRYRIMAAFIETYDSESLVFTVEDEGYVIPIQLQKNDLNATKRYLARNLQKGDIITIEGDICKIEINDEEFRGLTNAVIVETTDYEVKVKGTANIHLKGRSLLGALPKPTYVGQEEGIVVVAIKVDQYGTVTEAIPGAAGTTVTNEALLNASRSAALKAHFNQSANAPALQAGTISYIFKLK